MRFVTVRSYGTRYVVIDHRGRVYLRTENEREARRTCARVLARKRSGRRLKAGQANGTRLEIRQRGKHYTVVDNRGRVYAQETDYGYAVRAWRRALTGLSRQAYRGRT